MVTTADKNSAIGVLFDVDYDVIVRKRCFQRHNTLKFQKNFKNFFVLILRQRHGVIISVQPIRKVLRSGGRSLLFCLFTAFSLNQPTSAKSFQACWLCFEGMRFVRVPCVVYK